MKIELYDADDRNDLKNLSKQDFIGTADFMMHDLIRAKDQKLSLQLKDKSKNTGVAILQVEQMKERLSSNLARFAIECYSVNTSQTLFYRLFRSDGTSFFPVYQSESLSKESGNILWHKVCIPTASLFRDDESKPMKIELYQFVSNGNHKLLDVQEFKFASVLDNYKWESKAGIILFKNVSIERRASFLDYLFGGCQISLALAIDFTGSNGDFDMPSSLHYMNPATNQYMKAIRAIGDILQEYDSDKNIPVFGFGAKLPGFRSVSHCFALNGNIFGPEVHTIDGVLEVYKKNLPKLVFSGPTNFAEIIRYFGDFAYWHVSNGLRFNYFVLLIMTDGQITDMENTIDEVVRCSELPVSIIITGVGSEDFRDMDRLDADTNPLYSKRYKKYARRDIVQFVPFNQYAQNPQELAKQTLAELPKQLVDYMTDMRIPTNAPVSIPTGPDFYATKKSELINSFGPSGMAGNAVQLLEIGFPVLDIEAFSTALRFGYSNALF